VELRELLLKRQTLTLLDDLGAVFDTTLTSPQSPVTPGYAHKISQRLSAATRAEIAGAYAAGADSTDVAAQYSVARNTVLRLAREHDVAIRRQPVQADQLKRATQRYQDGWPLQRIARELGAAHGTVRKFLVAEGVTIRRSGP
jgi:hypothetical protein